MRISICKDSGEVWVIHEVDAETAEHMQYQMLDSWERGRQHSEMGSKLRS